ncbi:PREDICTED: DDB1- and CUL4-associated factor 4 isoform X1 [Dipodomys ordii]|uniref:DDB1- and CUL4-associated factor 4 n=1 Tax=Dipodomys ordii TaxID=10020 RepID=A0A1S3F9F5_DIPOR|nr:PREDICTED: DDB1- and CUL4-associated factor 4 isoform X1 [Dipodomys ordii]XP_012873288.1 PREDICTED: DDB1- and CUL4-associated factor 4 isoform X1 [Dipodomys ordii]
MKRSGRPSRGRYGRRNHQQNPLSGPCSSGERYTTGAAQSLGHGDEESPSTSSSSTGDPSVPDLPGFYYDPEKKRYFRLLPGHNNCNPLTKESIRHKEMESKRLQLLEEEDKQKKKIARVGFNASSFLRKSQLGFLNTTSYCRLAHELRVSCMERKKVQIQSSDPSALASDRFNLILADTNSERLFTVNDVKIGGSKYGIINLRGLKTPTLEVHMHENLYFTNRKVNSMCWASLNHSDSHILLCLLGLAETPGCVTLLPASLFVSSHPGTDRPGMLCSFRIPGAWSCAWCVNFQANNCFSTGLSRRVLLTDVVTGHRQSYGTNSDVLAQQFAVVTPLLFNGCRSGEIFAIDLRSPTQGKGWKATRLFHDSAVTSVKLLQKEQCLMASDMAGKIKLWDLRTTKCIREYEGHVNEYAYLPLHVHEEEGLLVAVGQDCYTRIWSLHDAQLLRTIPSPYPTSKADIPSVAFSSRLGGSRGAPGLLMAVRQDLYCFSYS